MSRVVATLLALLPLTAAAETRVEVEPGRLNRGRVEGTVEQPLARVVDVIADCDGFDEWFPDLLDTRPVVGHDGRTRCRGVTDMPWPLADRTWEIVTDVRMERVDGVETWVLPFEYVEGSGNISAMRGAYRLTAADTGRTHVEYEAWVDVGFWVPECVLAWATNRVLPGILDGLDRQAGRALAG